MSQRCSSKKHLGKLRIGHMWLPIKFKKTQDEGKGPRRKFHFVVSNTQWFTMDPQQQGSFLQGRAERQQNLVAQWDPRNDTVKGESSRTRHYRVQRSACALEVARRSSLRSTEFCLLSAAQLSWDRYPEPHNKKERQGNALTIG